MQLIPQPDDFKNQYIYKLSSATGLVNMAVWPVAFGFRVRGWIKDESFCAVDWCAGPEVWAVQRLYSILYNILSNREETVTVFEDLPGYSNIKPFFNDQDFVIATALKLKDPVEIFELPDLYEKKRLLMHSFLASCTPPS